MSQQPNPFLVRRSTAVEDREFHIYVGTEGKPQDTWLSTPHAQAYVLFTPPSFANPYIQELALAYSGGRASNRGNACLRDLLNDDEMFSMARFGTYIDQKGRRDIIRCYMCDMLKTLANYPAFSRTHIPNELQDRYYSTEYPTTTQPLDTNGQPPDLVSNVEGWMIWLRDDLCRAFQAKMKLLDDGDHRKELAGWELERLYPLLELTLAKATPVVAWELETDLELGEVEGVGKERKVGVGGGA